MPGSATALRQERLKKTNARPVPLGLFTINEEDEQQKNGNSRRPKAPDSYKVQEKKTAASNRSSSAISGQNSNLSGNKPDPPPVLRVDDRQRLARERREEREKQLAAREILWLEKEERARQHYEKHLEERKKKLEEQRLKEERRRAAVEEKRRQRLEEDKERHEAVVRRTMERSQKPKQKHNRWSWGGTLHGSPSIHSADPDRRSVSTMNLSKHVDPVISKRLSSSSATLLNSPDRARRLQLSPWESSVVNRLLTPTHSFLARSKSTAALSGDTASCSPINIMSYKAAHSRNPMDRPKFFVTPPEGSARRRTVHGTAGYKRERERENIPFHLTSSIRRAASPSNPKARSPASSRLWLPSKSFPHLPGTPRPTPSLPSGLVKAAPAQVRPLSPGNIRPVKREVRVEPERKGPDREPQKVANEPSLKGRAPLVKVEEATVEEGTLIEPEAAPAAPAPAPDSTPAPVPSPTPVPAPAPSSAVTASASPKTSAGTTDPEEATRLLAEKRRLAREQREKEEKEKREREELERQKIEELAQKVAVERTRREEESRRLEAEQAREREEQLRCQAEEQARREREEMERLRKQKEEEEARVRQEAERVRQEREKHFQREEQERLERKKRLEEIMKRTRRTEATDKKTVDQRNGDIAKGTLTEGTAVSALSCMMNSPENGEPAARPHEVTSHQSKVTVESTPNLEKQPNENGVSLQNENFEEIINLPIGSKPSRLDVTNSESPEIPLNPILAFDDEGLGPLPQVDGVQTQQTAEVI
ncbi:ensconsin isoform X2 [Rousettus aegyptiacus]|uniref:Microtubule associated protein 7 n=2 Tax=Rousettus aegyptiacus TaxID=9407 RepID=A0A7J8KC70_ROUAE|nr:ensconsin isoform X2 [Rousettus aegyptiacus]XP_036077859.1 ensconsin isoform X2 [Rousettus aegyptiacus]XP_036077860.1 ensconsin isoform X2 [Rousettus aegyptiacus]KAF6506434.1 microtubule associated protein 7 [Rousettus aegyptiacus]